MPGNHPPSQLVAKLEVLGLQEVNLEASDTALQPSLLLPDTSEIPVSCPGSMARYENIKYSAVSRTGHSVVVSNYRYK